MASPASKLPRLLSIAATCCAAAHPVSAQDTLRYEPVGTVALYRQVPHPSRVVLFLSGDGGWNLGVVDMARSLSALDALVVGIDLPRYLERLASSSERCSYPPADLEGLSQYVQRRLGFETYVNPIVVGYSSGATLAYTTLVQAPAGTFAGAISMGFCSDQTLAKALCRQNELDWEPDPVKNDYRFRAVAHAPAPWVVLHGDQDQVCAPSAVQDFVKGMEGASVVPLPGVGHGFSVQRNWMPQFRDAFRGMVAPRPSPERSPSPVGSTSPVGDLPLTELPAEGDGRDLAVLVTGDGGWAGIDQQIGKALQSQGVPVVGLSSLKYFWNARTPDAAAADLARILGHYLDVWRKDSVLLVGYSFGAEVLPFMVNRLPEALRQRVKVLALLAPGSTADFTFHVGDWFGQAGRDALPTIPEAKRVAVPAFLCLYGKDDTESVCPAVAPPAVAVQLPGGHHFGGDYQAIAARVLAEARSR
jgi:type IV secretory pathway VirJ component